MDWKNLRRDKLAKAASYRPAPTTGSTGVFEPVFNLWERFLAFSPIEKAMVVLAGVAVAIIGPVAVFALGGGGGSSAAGGDASATEVKISITRPTAGPTSTIAPTRSPTPTRTPTPEATATLNRRDCDEIAGTPYRSDEEREWFADQCSDDPSGPGDPSAPPTQPPPPTSPPVGPPNTPTPDTRYTASQAIAYAADWVLGQPSLDAIVVPGSCGASYASGVWVVGCRATTGGCGSGVCEVELTVCVNENPLDIYLC
ncbi:MAG: hypothetical protein WD939_01205 [Dehalococcoidia bacterium]